MTEEEIRLLICKSQEDGFKALLQQYYKYAYSIIWKKIRTVGTLEDAEDCVSDVFTYVFIHFSEIHTGTLQGYIATVSERTAYRYFHKLCSEQSVSADDEELDKVSDSTNVADSTERSEINKLLFNKVCSFGEPDATIIIQRYYYERNTNDIAKIVRLTPIAVRKRLSRALKKLRQILIDENIDLR